MPIDPKFQKNRTKVGTETDIAIWGPTDPPETLGIRGTYVAVDWDICTGCGACLETCPEQLYDWMVTPNHPLSEKKAFPARESDCVQCYKCEIECPVRAIRIIYPAPAGWLAWLGWLTFILLFLQLPGGVIYGVIFGPSLSLQTLFYIGCVILVLGLLFVFSSLMYFRRRGKPVEGRGVMATTVLVESGTYGIVRHPQFLGAVLMMCASILISQHWFFVLVGVPPILSMHIWVQNSEELLIAKFGDDYKRYMRRVPRMNLFLGILRAVERKKED
ncbi:MAG: 4Fe-4S binding protein [Candidatus Thorarchaeota archaeon]|nr:MAG: 4Fe-4S binding protein [Candidatus Thorarchaeota archaeon]